MYFKLELLLRNAPIRNSPFTIDYGGSHKIVVIITNPTEEEQKKGYRVENPFCRVTSQLDPSVKIQEMLQSLDRNKLPKGSKKPESWMDYIDSEGNIKEKHNVNLSLMPEPFIDFYKQRYNELFDYARQTVSSLRWRLGLTGFHNPFSVVGFLRSDDGHNWKDMPSDIRMHFRHSITYQVPEKELEEIKEFVFSGNSEPLGHDLFREAWEQKDTNLRSALTIGIAAAEIGLKQCVGKLAPDAKWLIENAPSPDLVKMLNEYLPLLNVQSKLKNNVFGPKSRLTDILKTGIQIRNQVVHGRSTTLTYEKLEEILLAVHDVLWILDYCCGYGWALNYVSMDIRSDLEK
jgi:hypothetical protein